MNRDKEERKRENNWRKLVVILEKMKFLNSPSEQRKMKILCDRLTNHVNIFYSNLNKLGAIDVIYLIIRDLPIEKRKIFPF